jgi:hypothetical protein
MKIPHHIHTQRVEPHRFNHPEPMLPVLVGDTGVVDLGGVKAGGEVGLLRGMTEI